MNPTDNDIDSIRQLDAHARELNEAAQAFRAAAGKPHGSVMAPAVLRQLEEALQALSAGWYELAADAAPGIAERRNACAAQERFPSPARGRSHEQEVLLMSTLHDVAAGFARCARTCREARSAVSPLVARRAPHQADSSTIPPSLRQEQTGAVA